MSRQLDIVEPAPESNKVNDHADVASLSQSSTDDVSSTAGSKIYATALLSTAEDVSARDNRYQTGRWELVAFYVYYIGNSGLSPFNFAPSQFQNLLYLQASNLGNGTCGDTGQPDCRLAFAGIERTVESIVLLCNGLSFAIQAVLFLVIGSFADYGKNRPYILMVSTVIAVAINFAWLGVKRPEQWQSAIALYMLGLVTYQLCLSYWTAAFPGLARNLPHMRQARAELTDAAGPVQTANVAATDAEAEHTDKPTAAVPNTLEPVNTDGRMTAAKYAMLETMAINRISNIAFAVCSFGELVVLAIMQGMLYGIHADRDTVSNTNALSAVVAFGAGVWLLCAIPWFVLEKRRPGQPLPPGTNYFTAALKQAVLAAKHLRHLRQTLIYLIFFFLFSDALNTSVTVISTIQNSVVSFSTTKLNILLIVGIAAQGVGIYAFWLIQKRFQLSTLFMFCWVIFFTILLQGWGFIGIFTQRFGFHHQSEIFVFQVCGSRGERLEAPVLTFSIRSGILWTLCVPVVRIFANDDRRSYTKRVRISFLQPIQPRREDVGVHRALCDASDCERYGQCIHALLLPPRAIARQLHFALAS